MLRRLWGNGSILVATGASLCLSSGYVLWAMDDEPTKRELPTSVEMFGANVAARKDVHSQAAVKKGEYPSNDISSAPVLYRATVTRALVRSSSKPGLFPS